MPIDPFGYHLVGCKINVRYGALHDNVVHKLVALLRSLRRSALSLESIHLFANFELHDNRRPDIIIHNSYSGGPQIIVDVAITGVNGQARRSDLGTDQPLHYRFNKKKAKHAQVAQDHGLSFVPAIVSHTGQIH